MQKTSDATDALETRLSNLVRLNIARISTWKPRAPNVHKCRHSSRDLRAIFSASNWPDSPLQHVFTKVGKSDLDSAVNRRRLCGTFVGFLQITDVGMDLVGPILGTLHLAPSEGSAEAPPILWTRTTLHEEGRISSKKNVANFERLCFRKSAQCPYALLP